MGILDYDIELAKQAIKRTPGLLNEYLGRLNSTLQDKFAINEMDQKRSMRGLDAMAGGDLKVSKQKLDNAIAQKMVNVGLDMNPGAVGQIVWHGSPHKFNKFDMSKIGTGEGAQAYGHGLYTAEAKDVGTEYMRKLAGSDKGMAGSIASNALRGRDSESAIEYLSGSLRGTPENKKVVQDAIDLIKSGEANNGYLYKVDIPDEAVARFLDWDKPLSEEMRQPLSKALMDKFGSGVSMGSGEQAYKQVLDEFKFSGHQDPKNAAIQWMNQNGVPGIRYLDGGSRGAGQGSSNFVLFDDQMPRILEINGQATGLQPWAKGEWRGLLGE